MPTYEYKCKQCDHQFDLWQEVGATAPACPECGAEVQKVFHPIRTIFKGSGFYITDSRPAPSKTETSDSKEPTTPTKTEPKTTESKESPSAPAKTASSTSSEKV